MNNRNNGIWRVLLLVFFISLLLFLLYWRWQVTSTRFFDVDEFAYMHWTAAVARGEQLYTDIFSYFTPGFMWVYAPIFWTYGVTPGVFTAARTLAFVIFLGILGCLGYVFGMTRGWKWALLPAVILAFLPMPYDKFLEIRPDNLTVLFALFGMIAEIRAIRMKNIKWWFLSGIVYSISLFILAKSVPIVVVGGAIALLSTWKAPKKFLIFLLGLFGPWALFFLGAALAGNFSVVWYSLTRLPFEVYKFAVNFPMEANLFFYPNVSFYGPGAGITTGLIVNHAIWILAIFVGGYRFVSPFVTGEGTKDKWLIELLIAGIFFVSIFGYVKFFPLKHSQYLIPIAVLIAYYAADGLSLLFDWLIRSGGYETLAIILAGFGYLLISVTQTINTPKLLQTNTHQLAEVRELIKTIPPGSRVVDMEGRMVFWPDGYPISGLPFDTFLQYVSRPPLPFTSYLSRHPAVYIWLGDSGSMNTFTQEDIGYIQSHFAPVEGWGSSLWKVK